ncbi:MAG: PEP-CTERM sorting domain-containing protein [Okeania sp. SIO2C2]|uniref:PEP-CTERM sorting domain-containing protein n=1 Tax=Okeania sp. SIO2C2 TaxID=2607787 RepID=UPI0013BD431D|nr:PEP-CTERM sorting domain-containing protein [Okeania sp. SIO2C2]NEP86899.1 PEP-CTERM sorting domain-containing protein [Okeania sp. SIO2C2]
MLKTFTRTQNTAAALAFIAIGLFTPPAQAQAITYTFSASEACDIGCTGNVDVMGIIETDGTLGAITTENIIDWELTFNSSQFNPTILSPDNSEITTDGAVNLMATADQITLDLFGVFDSESSFFSISDVAPPPFEVSYTLMGGSSTSTEIVITHQPLTLSDPLGGDEARSFINKGTGQRDFVLASGGTPTEPVPVPEPGLMLGLITLGGVMLGSKRKEKSEV